MTHIGAQPLETERLRLRRLTRADAPAFFAMMSDERVTRFLMMPRMHALSEAESLLEADEALYASDPAFYLWALEAKASGLVLGTVSLSVVDPRSAVAEAAYSLGYDHWGQGYAAEALRAALDFGFHQVGFNRIEALHSTQNPNSGKVLRRAGMLYEGMAREKYRNAQGYHDAHLYGMLKRDF